jgi:hypothetical protein
VRGLPALRGDFIHKVSLMTFCEGGLTYLHFLFRAVGKVTGVVVVGQIGGLGKFD